MRYSDSELKQSVFYPACGGDFRSILAFSHVSDLIIHVDLCVTQKDCVRDLQAFIKRMESILAPDSLELLETRNVNVNDIASFRGMRFPTSFERSPYVARLQYEVAHNSVGWHGMVEEPVGGHRQNGFWLVSAKEYTLSRKIGDYSRKVRLLYMQGEGLLAYSGIYKRGSLAPMALITTTTGPHMKLEYEYGVTGHFLAACRQKPKMWVRTGYRPGPNDEVDANGLPQYSIPVQLYGQWSTAAFRKARTSFHLLDKVSIAGVRQATIICRKFTLVDVPNYDAVFLTNFARKRIGIHRGPHIKAYPMIRTTLSKSLQYVSETCGQNGYKRVAVLPLGYEDEGVIINEWCQESGLPETVDIYCEGEYDFADLRRKK